ncbi:MAG: hypothetical protein MI922_06545 [Bacteroidales bacterium]|nr:hypothetical protein [Bacteroidales bacterium]
MKLKYTSLMLGLVLITVLGTTESCKNTLSTSKEFDTIYTNSEIKGAKLTVEFTKGEQHNHPLMVIWAEDTSGNYLSTLYIAKSIAKGTFEHGDKSTGKWMPGEIRRPAALPVWAHKRGVKEKDNLYIPTPKTAMPDAVTGATPPGSFILHTRIPINYPDVFNVFFEINQTWDWNEYWNNSKYPDDEEYKASCQPALVYSAKVQSSIEDEVDFSLIGHSSHNGSNGVLYTDVSTITTAKDITGSIKFKISY